MSICEPIKAALDIVFTAACLVLVLILIQIAVDLRDEGLPDNEVRVVVPVQGEAKW